MTNLEPKPRIKRNSRREADLRKVLDGFEANMFIINTGKDNWAVRVQPYMVALDRLQKAKPKSLTNGGKP